MSKCDKLLEAARLNPAGLRFRDACKLAECWGYELKDSKGKGGSHRRYKHASLPFPSPGEEAMCILSKWNGNMAPDYQVRQLLDKIDFIKEHFPNYSPY